MASITFIFGTSADGRKAVDYAYDGVSDRELFYALSALLIEVGKEKRGAIIEQLIEMDANGRLDHMFEQFPHTQYDSVSA